MEDHELKTKQYEELWCITPFSICPINKLKKVVVRPKYLTAGQGIF